LLGFPEHAGAGDAWWPDQLWAALQSDLLRDWPADHRSVLDRGARRWRPPGCAGAVFRAPLPDLHAGQRPGVAGRDGQRRPALLPLALWPGIHLIRPAGRRLLALWHRLRGAEVAVSRVAQPREDESNLVEP